MKKIVLTAIGWFVSCCAFAASGGFTSENGRELQATYFEGEGNDLHEVDHPTRAVRVIDVCGDGAKSLTVAQLWMPHHGHGSAPTSLGSRGENCMRVSNVQFIMRGLWEIRFQFSDGDRATLELRI